MNCKMKSKIELAHYIHDKLRQKLEEIDLYLTDLETTLDELEGIVNNEDQNL